MGVPTADAHDKKQQNCSNINRHFPGTGWMLGPYWGILQMEVFGNMHKSHTAKEDRAEYKPVSV